LIQWFDCVKILFIMAISRLERDIRRANRMEQKHGDRITDPFARFNLSLRGNNPDWIPVEGRGAGNLFVNPHVRELTRKITLEKGQKINTVLLNEDLLAADERKRGLVYLPEVNTAVTDGPCRVRLQALAKQLECPVLGLDIPSVGGSSDYTPEQLDALKQRQDYGPTANALAEAIVQTGLKEVSFLGVSQGGWTGPLVVEKLKEYGIVVHDLMLMSVPSEQGKKPWKLMADVLGQSKYLNLYHSRPYDPGLRDATGDNSRGGVKGKIAGAKWLASTVGNLGSLRPLLKTMVSGSLEANIRRALGEDRTMQVTYLYGQLDTVSQRESNDEIISSLEGDFPGQIHPVIIPGEHHLVYENGNRFAAFVKYALMDSPLLKK
jgi:pimeloyl-ACP methyl ester carboxylesterase